MTKKTERLRDQASTDQPPPSAADVPMEIIRGRQTAAPSCPVHGPCLARHSNSFFTYYYCRDANCSYSEKQPRPDTLNLRG